MPTLPSTTPTRKKPTFGHLSFFFFNDTATTEIYTLSLPDALPISSPCTVAPTTCPCKVSGLITRPTSDRKSTRLNSSHVASSYAVFCVKKKKKDYYYIQCDKHHRGRFNVKVYDPQ